jgi:hypothetical protein
MKVKIERSGGITGISSKYEANLDKSPPSMEDTAKKLLNNKESVKPKLNVPRGAADYFNYRITLTDGPKNRVIECNQIDMDEDLRSLIKFVEGESKK